jgi:hypothetical protein
MERGSTAGWGRVIAVGALTGAQTSFSYAAVFGIYAVIRAGLSVAEAAPADAWATAAALGVTLLYLVTVWGLLMAIPAACLGAFTAALVKLVQQVPAARRSPRAATNSGRLVALVLWPLLYVSLYALLRQRIAPVYLETFMFWYFMPGLIYLVLTGNAARRLAFG